MIQRHLLLSSLISVLALAPATAQVAKPIDETLSPDLGGTPAALQAQQELPSNIYTSPSGLFRVPIPVLPELGGRVQDSQNYVIFSDTVTTHITVGVIEMDASARFERSTMSQTEFLRASFEKVVLPQFVATAPNTQTDRVLLLPKVEGGTLYVGSLHPGTSQFIERTVLLGARYDRPPTARRGTLLFTKGNYYVIISSELGERATERSAHTMTADQENDLLRERLISFLHRIEFNIPAAAPTASPSPAPAAAK